MGDDQFLTVLTILNRHFILFLKYSLLRSPRDLPEKCKVRSLNSKEKSPAPGRKSRKRERYGGFISMKRAQALFDDQFSDLHFFDPSGYEIGKDEKSSKK